MAGSIFGKNFTLSTFGESHGTALGVVVDGVPAGLELSEEDIQVYLDRRAPGKNAASTPRKEPDKAQILSGIFEGKTTGTPICIAIFNTSQRSGDYSKISEIYRPGHADYTFDEKFGFRDYRGGGRSSGRETAARVAGGAIALKILKELGIEVSAYVSSIGHIEIDRNNMDISKRLLLPSCMTDEDSDKKAMELIDSCRKNYDSIGSSVECVVTGLPAGIGEPVFDKLTANLAKAVMSIGAVKSFEMGDGISVKAARGSENNDGFRYENGSVKKMTNHSGGTLGGISDGSNLFFKVSFKPTPSIYQTQSSVNKANENVDINIEGRHDPVIGPRASVVVEAMAGAAILDLMFDNMHSKMSNIKKIYMTE